MSRRLQVLIPEQLEVRIRTAALRQGVSKSAFVRNVLEQALPDSSFRGQVSEDPVASLAALNAPTADIEVMIAQTAPTVIE
jgi:hypothetical protein